MEFSLRSQTFGTIMGASILLLVVLIVSIIAHAGPDPQQVVSATIERDLETPEKPRTAEAKPKDGLSVYVMRPPQPAFQPQPVMPQPPVPNSPKLPAATMPAPAAPQPRDMSKLTVISVSGALVENTPNGPKQEWKLSVKNTDSITRNFTALIKFYDAQGRETHTVRAKQLSAPAGSTVTYSNTLVVAPTLPPNPTRVDAELLPEVIEPTEVKE